MKGRSPTVPGRLWEFDEVSVNQGARLRFGDLTVNVDTRQLLRGDEVVALSPKAFQLVTLLVEKRPRAISKTELAEALWPNTYVAETNLASLIAEIRHAIRDSAQNPQFIRTIHRFGYAFSGTAVEEGDPPSQQNRSAGLGCWLICDNKQIHLSEGENVIGREPEAAVWLDFATVSRRHARVVITGQAASVEDLGSKNGTFLRDGRITAATRIVDGDEIRIGSVRVRFRMPSAAGSTVSLGSRDGDSD